MKVFLGTDHAGLEFKDKLFSYLKEEGYDVEDCGPDHFDPDDDYPDFIGAAAKKESENEGSMGIVMGGSGQGEQMAANKYKGVRCALFYAKASPSKAVDVSGKQSDDPFEIIKLTRQHNNANMLSLGIRFLNDEDAKQAVKLFLETPFKGEERHQRRIDKIAKIESTQ
jgi:ribose 5-phosphate isomerase B